MNCMFGDVLVALILFLCFFVLFSTAHFFPILISICLNGCPVQEKAPFCAFYTEWGISAKNSNDSISGAKNSKNADQKIAQSLSPPANPNAHNGRKDLISHYKQMPLAQRISHSVYDAAIVKTVCEPANTSPNGTSCRMARNMASQ